MCKRLDSSNGFRVVDMGWLLRIRALLFGRWAIARNGPWLYVGRYYRDTLYVVFTVRESEAFRDPIHMSRK